MLVCIYMLLAFGGLGLAITGGMLLEGVMLASNAGEVVKTIVFGGMLLVIGILALAAGCISISNALKGKDIFVVMALKFKEKNLMKNPLRRFLVSFRNHYSEFFGKMGTKENEAIQWEATQIYRNLLGFRKKRLRRFGITCEMLVRNMKYSRRDGISVKDFSDGKYDITEVEEEVASQTIYKKDGKEIYSQVDKDLACYTIVHTKQVGEDKILCPNCGMEATREELMDGCDYCGTKFLIEDLDDRVTDFSFRPDYKAALSRYKKERNRICINLSLWIILGLSLILGVFVVATTGGVSGLLDAEDGIMMNVWMIYIMVASLAFIIVPTITFLFGVLIFPIFLAGTVGANMISKSTLKKLKIGPKNDKSFTETIQKYDPNFSISNFYSSLQNKIASVIYAENKAQIEAFSAEDLSGFLGRYKDVINIETEYMGVLDYSVDETNQYILAEVCMRFLRYKENQCVSQEETWNVRLFKSAECKTQVLCAPAMMTCQSCGAPFDLLSGKECEYCGNIIQMENYDWVIQEIKVDKN